MARERRIVFSEQHLDIERIERHRQDAEAAVGAYFAVGSPASTKRFLGYTPEEVRTEKDELLQESRRSASMDVFGALEATFRIDFLQRCYRREKDAVSVAFRHLYSDRGARVSLEADILGAWKGHSNVIPSLIADLRSAFKYRHWLAHGRYWTPKFPKLDYGEVYTLAAEALDAFPFKGT